MKSSLQKDHYQEGRNGYGWLKHHPQQEWVALFDQTPEEVVIWPSSELRLVSSCMWTLMMASASTVHSAIDVEGSIGPGVGPLPAATS